MLLDILLNPDVGIFLIFCRIFGGATSTRKAVEELGGTRVTRAHDFYGFPQNFCGAAGRWQIRGLRLWRPCARRRAALCAWDFARLSAIAQASEIMAKRPVAFFRKNFPCVVILTHGLLDELPPRALLSSLSRGERAHSALTLLITAALFSGFSLRWCTSHGY